MTRPAPPLPRDPQRICAEIEAFANRYGIDYLRTSTAMPFEDIVLKYLRQGGLIK